MEYSSRESLIQYFEAEIKRMSDADIAKLKKEIDADKQKELARMELEVQHQVNLSLGVELQDVKEKYRMDVNAVLAENAAKLHERRTAIAEEVFSSVTEKIQDFVAGPDYPRHLEIKLGEIKSLFPGEDLTVIARKGDTAVLEAVRKVLGPKVSVVFEDSIRLGGFRVHGNQSLREADETFDFKLEQKKEWFYANSRLFIKK